MRGGSKAAFDGDQILKIKKHENYQEDSELKFKIYTGQLIQEGENDNTDYLESPISWQPVNF